MSVNRVLKHCSLLLWLILPLAGCVTQQKNSALTCDAAWNEFVAKVEDEGVGDAQDWPLPDYTYLRIDRTATYLAQQSLDHTQREAWIARSYELGRQARHIENQRLSNPIDLELLDSCLQASLPKLVKDENFWRQVADHPRPDAYETWQQVLGLYPLLRPLVDSQIEVLNQAFRDHFQQYQAKHDWHRYSPPVLADANTNIPLTDMHFSPLGLPKISAAAQSRLLKRYAPEILLEAGHPDDRIGAPFHDGDQWTTTNQPIVYTRLGETRWQGKWVLQLIYHWWYPARPSAKTVDIYAGRLDGLIWRVTIDSQGKVLFYDSVHPCGCYHKLFPVDPDIRFRGQPDDEESLMVLPVTGIDVPVSLKITSGAHYVVGAKSVAKKEKIKGTEKTTERFTLTKRYRLEEYRNLRSNPSGAHYLFNDEGLVEGSERLERFLLWGMGVPSAGAMRQWGSHAIAFTSRRHFDDPVLFERYFTTDSSSDASPTR